MRDHHTNCCIQSILGLVGLAMFLSYPADVHAKHTMATNPSFKVAFTNGKPTRSSSGSYIYHSKLYVKDLKIHHKCPSGWRILSASINDNSGKVQSLRTHQRKTRGRHVTWKNVAIASGSVLKRACGSAGFGTATGTIVAKAYCDDNSITNTFRKRKTYKTTIKFKISVNCMAVKIRASKTVAAYKFSCPKGYVIKGTKLGAMIKPTPIRRGIVYCVRK